MSVPRVVVADAQRLVAEALGVALAERAGFDVVAEHPSEGAAALGLVVRERPDVALIDFWLPDLTGPALVARLCQRVPATKVLVISWHHGPSDVAAVLDAGAVGFLPKGMSLDQVIEAVGRATGGEDPVFAEALGRAVEAGALQVKATKEVDERFAALTTREMEVLMLVAEGRSAADIAGRLGVREPTVRTHITRILQKTKAGSQLEAVSMARRRGILR